MDKENKSSILKEALSEYNAIMEAADANAKKKLAEEFSEKFNDLLKEELSKNNAINKSYKKIEENEELEINNNKNNNEITDMKKEKKETNLVDNDESIDTNKNEKKTVKSEEEKNIQKEEFDITELDISTVGTTLENADDDDEIITMDDIENEIKSMEELGEELENISNDIGRGIAWKSAVYRAMTQMRNAGAVGAEIVAKGLNDQMDLIGNVTFGTVVFSVAITTVFALIINSIAAVKMKDMDMLESLKSVE